MPYIPFLCRAQANDAPRTSGELNFALTQVMLTYLDVRGKTYDAMNDCLGALEGAKLELYRRVIAPYEDRKRDENGDVY